MSRKIIIDTDPGCDDTILLSLALTDPQIDILGITIIGGNVDPLKTLNNAKGICKLLGRDDVPVIGGCHRPLDPNKTLFNVPDVHGESGVGGLLLPTFRKAAELSEHIAAARFIIEQSHKHPGLELFVIGPMTNVALAYQMDSTLPQRVGRIFTMGGAYGNPKGNVGNEMSDPQAEFNIFCDPLAAQIVYAHFTNIMAVPLDVTHTFENTSDLRNAIHSMGGHGPNWANMLEFYAAEYPGFKNGISPIHDAHTYFMALYPELYSFASGSVLVDTEINAFTEGQTRLTRDGKSSTQVAQRLLDEDRFRGLLIGRLSAASRQGQALVL